MTDASLDAMLTLTLVPGLGPTLTRRCLAKMGSAQAVLGAGAHHLAQIRGIGLIKAQQIRRAIDSLADGAVVSKEKELLDQHRATVLTIQDPRYPKLLKHIPDPPPLIYVRGTIHDEDAVALAVVGTRRCSLYGRQQADRLAAQCAQAGLCIVSGGAYGVDAAAHRAALRVGGRTIAVLGSGLANPYPADHAELFDAIAGTAQPASGPSSAEAQGAVISELPMSTPPLAENFPSRNRIISGLSLGVLVVEAPSRSGAMITARLAAEEHHREVMAVPGRADSRSSGGCHRMIREGWATLVTTSGDIMDNLGETGQLLKAAVTESPGASQSRSDPPPTLRARNLTEAQQRLFEVLGQPHRLDQLVAATGQPVSAIQADLTMLELRGLIHRDHGTYTLKQT